MIRKETLYQATRVNGMRDSLALLSKGCKIFVDFRSVFPMFTFIESKCVTNHYIGFQAHNNRSYWLSVNHGRMKCRNDMTKCRNNMTESYKSVRYLFRGLLLTIR